MRTLMKVLVASVALAGLAGCASYDYGYAYERPYYGYDYGYAPYYYDYGYPYYGPAYYYGGPTVGFDFRFRDRDRFDHRGRFDRHERLLLQRLAPRPDTSLVLAEASRHTRPLPTARPLVAVEKRPLAVYARLT